MLEFIKEVLFWGFYGLIALSCLFIIVANFFVQQEKYNLRSKRGE